MKAFSDFLGIPLESASVDEKAFDRAERSVVEKPVVIDNAPMPVPASSEIAVPNETAKPLVEVVGGRPVTTSVRLAEVFEKNHRNVLRDIRALMAGCDDDFNALNFELIEYVDAKGRKKPAYAITHDAFSLLAMGFTGQKALK
ncbi:MAG: Rha family transcriptional regulator [Desulfovibrio sp.]|nr:Rha family transcriptional regulator [Desulfovibrio sp.]